jgi:hypothetical protein
VLHTPRRPHLRPGRAARAVGATLAAGLPAWDGTPGPGRVRLPVTTSPKKPWEQSTRSPVRVRYARPGCRRVRAETGDHPGLTAPSQAARPTRWRHGRSRRDIPSGRARASFNDLETAVARRLSWRQQPPSVCRPHKRMINGRLRYARTLPRAALRARSKTEWLPPYEARTIVSVSNWITVIPPGSSDSTL